VISGFRCSVKENFIFLGFYAAWISSSLSRFASTYWSNLQRPNCLTFEDGTDRLSRNVGNKLSIYAA